ncbi:endonuclease/exonuclease/phosphatase family protein [Herbiconiux sp. CPCC 205763]|uniref:Endonuclease/exonuclease/phosphatase family protein n=1 Tax=Herbiconiux aconitum TaxID=2970913 RepID=A0ABT2GQZ6_9MICO|nr:endonuclease/exonuclease/phosphatase family protein [Herbiconiux aconitum]MCS5718634.1 endonuclease/exonuclease/phosphatase family protein [Herbiconiux aconitum]
MSALLEAPRETREPQPRRRPRIRTGLAVFVCVLALALAAGTALHVLAPELFGFSLVVESALPWFGLAIPVLFVLAFISRAKGAVIAALVPALVWSVMFVPAIVPLSWSAPAASGDTLTIASQNVEADSGTAADSATALAASGAQVIALQEMDSDARDQVEAVLSDKYPYSYGIGTVGVWSTYPILNAQALDLGLGWQRAIAADLQTPTGLVSIYVIHAASARPGEHADRDTMLANLADYIPRDENDRILMVGDFNAGSSDRNIAGLTGQLSEANQSGGGFGFTWPAAMPITRPDHVLQRGMEVTSNSTLRAGASDHLAVLTTLNL